MLLNDLLFSKIEFVLPWFNGISLCLGLGETIHVSGFEKKNVI